jgi:hypothetical protein
MRFEARGKVIMVLYVWSLLRLAVSASQTDCESTRTDSLSINQPAIERDKFSAIERTDTQFRNTGSTVYLARRKFRPDGRATGILNFTDAFLLDLQAWWIVNRRREPKLWNENLLWHS